MTLLSLRRPGLSGGTTDDATLLRRARRGDRRAHRLFARRHAARAVELVELLCDPLARSATQSATLAAAVLDATIAAGIPGDAALVRGAVRALRPATDDAGLSRLVVALTDGEGRSEEAVSELIQRSQPEVSALRAEGQSQLGVPRAVGNDCRGWALAARRDRLTVSEREAAHGHLAVCRACRARLEDQRRTRDKLRMSGTAVSAVVIADVVALSVPTGGAVASASGVASLVLGKASVAGIGAAAVAIAATSVGVAAARVAPSHDRMPGFVSREDKARGTRPNNVSVPHNVSASTTPGAVGTLPSPSTTTKTRQAPPPALPPLPTSSVLPTTLPTTLPTVHAPLPLPTGLPSVTPLPTLTSAPTVPVTLPTGVIATAASLLGH